LLGLLNPEIYPVMITTWQQVSLGFSLFLGAHLCPTRLGCSRNGATPSSRYLVLMGRWASLSRRNIRQCFKDAECFLQLPGFRLQTLELLVDGLLALLDYFDGVVKHGPFLSLLGCCSRVSLTVVFSIERDD